LIDERLEEKHLEDLRRHTQQQRTWGSERFQQQIEALTQRSVSVRPRARPSKSTHKQD
jgi:putative transposase